MRISHCLFGFSLLLVVSCSKPNPPPPVAQSWPIPVVVGDCHLVSQQTLTVHDSGGLVGNVYVLPHNRVMTLGGQVKCE